MKRITTFILATAFVLGGLGAAHAESNIDVKVKGSWDFNFGVAQNTSFFKNRESRDDDSFIAKQRVRTQINFIASENLQGVLMFEIGELNWGHNTGNGIGKTSGGQIAADGVNIATKRAFLDWMIPDTSVSIRMGIQGFELPMATGLGNPVMNDDVAGVVANYQFDDNFSLTGFWLRPYDAYLNDSEAYGKDRHFNDEADVFGVAAPMMFDGVSVTPWFAWANVGSASGLYEEAGLDIMTHAQNKRASAWWLGTSLSIDILDPLTFAIDAMYGHLQRQDLGKVNFGTEKDPDIRDTRAGASGWFVASTLNYKLDWATPGLFGWWSSGDSEKALNGDKSGRIPTLAHSSGFGPTSFGFDGAFGIGSGTAVSMTGAGTWGIGIQLADMSFIEDLTHTLRFAYYRGTNQKGMVKVYGLNDTFGGSDYKDHMYLTKKDSAYEINFDHKYQIYENLVSAFEIGYIHMNLNEDTWGNDTYKTDNAWKVPGQG